MFNSTFLIFSANYLQQLRRYLTPPSPPTHSPTPQQSVSFFIPSSCACNASQCEPFQSSVDLCKMCNLWYVPWPADILQWINRLQGEENLEKRPCISLTFAFYYGHQHYFACNVVWWIGDLNVWKRFMNQDHILKKDKITRCDVCEGTCTLMSWWDGYTKIDQKLNV